MNIHQETDLLARVRAEKKLAHWQSLADKGVTVITGEEDGIIYEVAERIKFWASQAEKYEKRILKHIEDFQNVNDIWGLTKWVSSVVNTIRDIINSLTK